MPKFARPNSYTGKQSNQYWTGDVRAATLAETIAGDSKQIYISPFTLDAAIGAVIGPATETSAGIAEIATQTETNTGTDDQRIITPLKLKTNLTTPPAIGGTTPAAGTFTTLTSNGNIIKNVAGNKDVYTSIATTTTAGANSAGTVTLTGGTATISTTSVTANSKIRMTRQSVGATGAAALGVLSIGTITAGTSFVINAVQAASATSLQATDVSVILWEIIN